MALATNSHWTIRETATTGNVNGAGFNPANANFLTDLTTDTNTANTASPVVSSASYNFVAADVGAFVYIQSGTNWTVGWYQIASVASNKATLNATVGAAQKVINGFKYPSTVVGCATVGTPTGGTFGIDYSQQNTADATATDYASVGASTTLTSATGGFRRLHVGNIFHQKTTGTGAFGVTGWYEIVSYTSATSVVLDRSPNSGTASVACTGYVGGAGRLNGLEDAFCEIIPSGGKVWIQSGTYTTSAAIAIVSTNGTITNPITYMGYVSVPGDFIHGVSAKPLINLGSAAGFSPGSYTYFWDIEFTGNGASVVTTSQTTSQFWFCKATNTSNTANRSAWISIAWLFFCEGVAQFGYAFSHGGSGAVNRVHGCYFHDSVIGMFQNSAGSKISQTVVANCTTASIRNVSNASSIYLYDNCTLYGRYSTPMGIGFDFTNAAFGNATILNNIIAGQATGVNCAALTESINGFDNLYYGNTVDAVNFYKDPAALSSNPSFTDVTEIAITNGTITGGTAVLTSSGADFSTVEVGVDYFTWLSHSGGTGTFIGSYLITSRTTTTLTFNINAGTSGSVTDVTGYIQTGHNFAVGAALKGSASFMFGNATTSYLDVGAVQRQELGSATTVGYASMS